MTAADDVAADPRNRDALVFLNGDLVPRATARVPVGDAFAAGDGIWEGLRLHRGKVLFAERHVERLYAGARAIDLDIGMARDDLIGAIELTCTANRMNDDVYIRVIVTRGADVWTWSGGRAIAAAARPTVAIIAEYRPATQMATAGIRLFTAATRCSPPDIADMRLKSLARLNLVTAQIQARKAGADEALLLDPRGFVATAGSANVFLVRAGAVYTSSGAYCLNGITRASVIQLCDSSRIPAFETDITLAEAYAADEIFVTGTLAGITPVRTLDGRDFGRAPGTVTARIRSLYDGLLDREVRR